ncbi:RDD family protein [Aliidiomarina indica]|uniref:RDD family protein n=1 Tax=Aliidiomarina indica TaxID=2749147 RepID=UPI0018903843|nr:RDD family protein [Aliidiomarina indica]
MENYHYAGFWLRLGAAVIDTIILLIVIGTPLSFIYGVDYWLDDRLVHGTWDVLLSYVFPFVATIWFWRRFLGTPGKMGLKLRVVDAVTGDKLTVAQSIGRYFAYIISGLPLGLGFIWIGIDAKKQGWHDKLAGTVVIVDTAPTPVKFDQKV